MKKFVIGILFCALCQSLTAQVAIQIIRPQTLTLASREIWNCIITNAGNQAFNVYLHGTVSESRDGKIYEINSASFALAAGTTQFNTQNYQVLSPEQVLFKSNLYEEYLLRTNGLPRGEYRFCIDVIESGQLNLLSTSCIDFSVLTSTPPAIVLPTMGDSICEPNPFFIWTPPQPPLSGADVSYSLLVYEVQGFQTPIAATQSAPPWYFVGNIATPVFQYGIEGRPFVSGRTYAWYVVAKEGKQEVSRSDIGYFIWRSCQASGEVPNAPSSGTVATNKAKKGVQYYHIPAFDEPKSVTVTEKNLNVSYVASTHHKTVFARLENENGQAISTRDLPVVSGYNFWSLEPAAWKMDASKHHVLVLMNANGEIQRLRFWYKPKV